MKPHVAFSSRLDAAVSRDELLLGAAVVLAELLLVVGYFGVTPGEPTSLRYVAYPFVWINLGLLAVLKTAPPSANRRQQLIAGGVAGAYFLVLLFLAGLVGIHSYDDPTALSGFRFIVASPGWGPAVTYVGATVRFAFVPYLVIGYFSLAYLVYVTMLDATRAVVSGLLGLFSCVGCTFPIVASLVAGAAGGASSLTTAVYSMSTDISTVVFVLALALLYWRPTR